MQSSLIRTPAGPVLAPGLERRPLGPAVHGHLTAAKADDGRVDLQERRSLHGELDTLRAGLAAFRGEKESFTASITGDPHFAVEGSIDGEQVSAAFDNQDLGNRTQYAGAGFRLDTNTVPWGDGGAAVVGSATVTTGFGRAADRVTVGADGSVLVNGEAVQLESGQTMGLNRTSSLTMNEDGSYTVSSRNGKVTNTFSAQEHEAGDFLNVTSTVDGVQTRGWLQQQV